MRRLCLMILFCLWIASIKAQSISYNYSKDLDRLYNILMKTPSYKHQIKGVKKDNYIQLYQKLKTRASNIKTDFDNFYYLSQLIIPLKDNHLAFWQSSNNGLSYSKFADSLFIRNYRESKEFKNYPKVSVSMDSLERELINKPKDGVEGVYYFGNVMKVGIYRTHQKDSLLGVVLASKYPIWQNGQIALVLKEYLPNRFNVYHSNILNKDFELYKNVQYKNASLNIWPNWRKYPTEVDYVDLGPDSPVFKFKKLNSSILYIRLGSFSSSTKSLIESQTFFDAIKDSLKEDHLILDLRNNGGGGWKSGQKYISLLRKYSKLGKIYVLINNQTISYAERFTLKLKGLNHILIAGENTKGTLAYGSNYGKTETLPSGKFKVYVTDMKDKGNYLQYEDVGVSPDVYLNPSHDWIEQIKGLIVNK